VARVSHEDLLDMWCSFSNNFQHQSLKEYHPEVTWSVWKITSQDMEMVRGKEKNKSYGFTQGIWVLSLSKDEHNKLSQKFTICSIVFSL